MGTWPFNYNIMKRSYIFLFFITTLCNFSSYAGENFPQTGKTILVLHTFKAKNPWVTLFNKYLMDALEESVLTSYHVEFKTLDLSDFSVDIYNNSIDRSLINNDAKFTPDVLILTYPAAIQFIYERKMFPDVPRILILPNEIDIPETPNSIQLPFVYDFKGNIEHCIELLPDTNKIYVIAGNGDLDNHSLGRFKEDIKDINDPFSFHYLTGLSMEDILNRIKNLPPKSVIYYLSYSKDPSGRSVIARDFCELLGKNANRPVFTFWDLFALNTGILGGRVTTTKYFTSISSEIIKKLIEGEAISSIKIGLPYFQNIQYIYDWQEITKWRIDPTKFPPNSIVQNKTCSLFELFEYKFLNEIWSAPQKLRNYYLRCESMN
jgi:hypothetical protein